MSLKETIDLASDSFRKIKCVTYERYKLFMRMHEEGETLEAFQTALTAQAAISELITLVDEKKNSEFKYPFCPIQEKGRRIPIHIQDKLQAEIQKLFLEVHITKLDKCTRGCFIAQIVKTVKNDR